MSRAALLLVAVISATLGLVFYVHKSQKWEREVRSGQPVPFDLCESIYRERSHAVSIEPCLCMGPQNLHKGVVRDDALFALKSRQQSHLEQKAEVQAD